MTHSRKHKFITETEDIQIATNIGETTRAHSSRMTHLGQSRKETQKPTASIVKTAGWQSWANVRNLAANRSGWKENVKALCALWHKEI